MSTVVFRLPYPPSTNTYYRNVVRGQRSITLISERGREYRKEGLKEIRAQRVSGFNGFGPTPRLRVGIWLYMPDRRKRDCDNYQKALLDLLTHAGVYGDDSQIDHLTTIRAGYGGYVLVKLEPIEEGLF